VATHLTGVPFGHILHKPDDPSPAERKLFKHNQQWLQKEGAYALVQSSKPQRLAQGLNDSPSGLAARIVEKSRDWSDCGGDIESRFTQDELLTHKKRGMTSVGLSVAPTISNSDFPECDA
jgi:hypothetical protein